jgi:hypothetical protein
MEVITGVSASVNRNANARYRYAPDEATDRHS